MIQSMTGYGAAELAENGVAYSLEVRAVNHRYLKLSIKQPEHLQFLETEIEKQLRSRLGRGSVSYTLRTRSELQPGLRTFNMEAVQHYVSLLSSVTVPDGVTPSIDLATVATLPGVCEGPELDEAARGKHAAVVTKLTDRALDAVIEMRAAEGKALRDDLQVCAAAIHKELERVAARAPVVIEEYHERLRQRVSVLVSAAKLELDADALTREVAVFADRADISEEIARLRSHLVQFDKICERNHAAGRTLDFLTQELLREANTIASKSNDAEIARGVVEIKRWIDRLKEQVQNVE